MLFWLIGVIRTCINSLYNCNSPAQLSAGILMGMYFGFLPTNLIVGSFLLIILAVFKINIAITILFTGLFSLFGPLLYPLSDVIGTELLINQSALEPLWTTIYNTPILSFSGFNNTVMLGSFIISMILSPVLFIMMHLVIKRSLNSAIFESFMTSTPVKIIKNSKLVTWLGRES